MTDTRAETTPTDAAATLRPLLGTLDLAGGDAAGACSGGVCHIPAPPAQKDSTRDAE